MISMDWEIQPSELKAKNQPYFLLDVREFEEYCDAYIEGSHLIPLGELMLRAPDELKLEDEIIVYCAHGVRSLYAVAALRKLGFQKTKSLHGGIEAWKEENGSIRSSH